MNWIRTSLLLPALAASIGLFTRPGQADSLDDRVVDSIRIGEEQDERSHKYQGELSDKREFNGRTNRFAATNGWFSWELSVLPVGLQELRVEWAVGRERSAAGTTEILVDGSKLASARIGATASQDYYPLSPEILQGKRAITVRFQGAAGSRVGEVAGLAVLKRPPPTIASTSTPTSPRTNYEYIVKAINDLREPRSSGDRMKRHFDWWPAKGTNQWVQYDFARPARVSAVEVYWFDDTGVGECRLPKSWRLLFRQNGEWKPVTHSSGYGCEGNCYNRTTFDPVETEGLRLEAQLPERFSSGLLQWRVE